MAYHGVLIPEAIAATNIDALNRSVIVSASSIDNGYVLTLASRSGSTPAGYEEVWVGSYPTTGSLTGLWMAYSGDEIPLTDSRYKGIDPDPRNFYNSASRVFSAYKPQVGDIILLTGDAISGSYAAGITTHVIATTGTFQMAWAAGWAASTLSYKYLKTGYISLATGSIGTQRVAAYELECVIA